MSTVSGASLASKDVARLDQLVAGAGRRLAAQAAPGDADALMTRLQRLAIDARRQPADRAIALFASPTQQAIVHLPIPVVDRIVVDPTFATRDLTRALVLRPRLRILVASELAGRILEGWPGRLADIGGLLLAAPANPTDERRDRSHSFGRERTTQRTARAEAHFRHLADIAAARHTAEPMPLIIAAVTHHLAAWRARPETAGALIGTIAGNHDRTPPARLDHLGRRVLDTHLHSVRRAALDRLAGEDPARCAFGIDSVWRAATAGRVATVCVEDGFVCPAQPVRGGRHLQPVRDVVHPDVLDDAVDEVIELVANSGGEITLVHDGALQGCGHIAATLHTR